ncbi:hypothetical protein LY76DRAFT_10263 [Colletotrichum caudatum]|nr:hypothetical protein LY76DRAFT_10263 [Colletotrichum caudatum]
MPNAPVPMGSTICWISNADTLRLLTCLFYNQCPLERVIIGAWHRVAGARNGSNNCNRLPSREGVRYTDPLSLRKQASWLNLCYFSTGGQLWESRLASKPPLDVRSPLSVLWFVCASLCTYPPLPPDLTTLSFQLCQTILSLTVPQMRWLGSEHE